MNAWYSLSARVRSPDWSLIFSVGVRGSCFSVTDVTGQDADPGGIVARAEEIRIGEEVGGVGGGEKEKGEWEVELPTAARKAFASVRVTPR